MNRSRLHISVLAVSTAMFLVASTPGLAAPGASGAEVNQALVELRRATVQYHDVSDAGADGFVAVTPCIEAEGLGGMGVHYLKPSRLDATLEPLEPEFLVYAVNRHGDLRLVAVEYMVVALVESESGLVPWFGASPPADGFATPRPSVFGTSFEGPMPGHGSGQAWHYDLHVWVWRGNPDGVFATWNPQVTCP